VTNGRYSIFNNQADIPAASLADFFASLLIVCFAPSLVSQLSWERDIELVRQIL